jgi:uncharacterized protein (UPF0264 family)
MSDYQSAVPSPRLLVSVRSVEEAEAALAGGAALIDVKEPARGALGRADDEVVRAIMDAVRGRRPVSAALGEWVDQGRLEVPDIELTFVKWGLAGCARRPDWRWQLTQVLQRSQRPRVALVAYADWKCAQAPSVDDVFALACDHAGSALLVDTHCKDHAMGKQRPTLLDWLPLPWIEDLCVRARAAHIPIALAGSLGPAEIRALLPARPDWFAVRGAVCVDADRQATVQVAKVRQLVDLIAGLRPQVDDLHF